MTKKMQLPVLHPNPPRAQRKRVAVESEEIPTIAQFSPQGGNGAVVGISELVDDTGLEPVTPCTSSRCSSQLS